MAVEFSADEQQLALRLTGDRGQHRDRARMRPDPILTSVARARAEDMAHRRYFSHVNPDGLGPNFLVRARRMSGSDRDASVRDPCAGHGRR
jgi:uncharacterized protein YkwD